MEILVSYRRRAAYSEMLAGVAGDLGLERQRQEILRVAATWRRMAAEREAALKREAEAASSRGFGQNGL